MWQPAALALASFSFSARTHLALWNGTESSAALRITSWSALVSLAMAMLLATRISGTRWWPSTV